MQMGVNHFGHVLLTELLLPLIKRAVDISGVTMGEKGKIISNIDKMLYNKQSIFVICCTWDNSGSKPRIINVSSIASLSGNIDKNTIELYTKVIDASVMKIALDSLRTLYFMICCSISLLFQTDSSTRKVVPLANSLSSGIL